MPPPWWLPVFAISCPAALRVVGYVGAFSALFAATIACTQTDIKRVLAYSTMSQIGYMMTALGVSGYGGEYGLGFMAAMFHLFTHAMFKALLFLAAGAIIHYVHSNEMKDMGGLRKLMPVTHATFLIACLAIAGIPPFSGFFSKEEILTAALHENKLIYAVALFTSGLTAFYMFRLYFSIFWNKERQETAQNHHGEGPVTMLVPLMILGIAAAIGGFIPFGNFVTSDGAVLETGVNILLSVAPVLLGLAGILIAMRLYKSANAAPEKIALDLGQLYRSAFHKFYIDEIYLFVTQKIIFNLVGRPAAWIDKNIVDGAVNLSADLTEDTSGLIRNWQSGKLQQYAIWFLAGAIGMVVLFIYLL
jgi:NADH-quinone oxidoreductase subunit L